MGQEVTREELLEHVQLIAPVVREDADWGEQHGHLADPIVEAIRDADLYRMLVPRELGGLEVDPLTFYQVVEALARIDGSTGWCMFINGGGPFSTMFLRDEAAESILSNDTRAIMAGTVFPLAGRCRVQVVIESPRTESMQAGAGMRIGFWLLAISMRMEHWRLASLLQACPTWYSFISRVPRYGFWTLGTSAACARLAAMTS